MNLRFLETFAWVARLRSFRQTAEKLFTTQASISARIAASEEELGVRLFDRGTRGVQLTSDGHKVLEYADRMVSTLREMCQRFFVGTGVVAALPVLLAVPAQAGGLCTEPWVYDGSHVKLDSNGKTPMIVEFTLHDISRDMQDGCEIGLHIYAKSGLVALGGRPIETEQEHQLLVDEAGVVARIVSINGRVFAQSEHAELIGTVSTAISGMFLYGAGLAPEAKMLPGDSYDSSFDLEVVSPRLGITIAHMRAAHARVDVSEREVGPLQALQTPLGPQQCRPIRYTRTATLGVLQLGDETVEPEPTVARVTDWFCPAQAMVVRQDVEQHGETQVIDVVQRGR